MRRVPFSWFVAGMVAVTAVAAVVRVVAGEGPPEQAAPPPSATQEPALPDPPPCRIGDEVTRFARPGQWRKTLVDTTLRVPESYEPPELASTADAGFPRDIPIRPEVVDDLAALREAAEGAGLALEVSFGYRSHEYQRRVFEDSRRVRGRRAVRFAARPGHSEHQLGTALDFKTEGGPPVDQSWGRSREGRWMAENAWRYGFVLSYPRGTREVTCYAYEPWHFRYFGRGLARRIHRSGLTPREFLWAHFHAPEG